MTIDLYFTYNKKQLNSIFHRDTLLTACLGIKTLSIYSCGHSTAYLPDDLTEFAKNPNTYKELVKYIDLNLQQELIRRNYTDKEIQFLFEQGLVDEQNWFEWDITYTDENTETIYSEEIAGNIDEALEILNLFIKNKLK